MSEQFNPLDEARKNADADRARYYDAMGRADDKDYSSNQEYAAANSDFADYLEGRSETDVDAKDIWDTEGTYVDSIDRAIAADPSLRRMASLANEIREIGNKEVAVKDAEQLVRMSNDKQDKLAELLAEYESSESKPEIESKEDIMSRILDRTEIGPVAHSESEAPADDTPEKTGDTEPDTTDEEAAPEADEADDDEAVLESKKTDENQFDENDMDELRKKLDEEDAAAKEAAYEGKHRAETGGEDSPIHDDLKEETDAAVREGESLEEYEARQPGRHAALIDLDDMKAIAGDGTDSETEVIDLAKMQAIADSDDAPATRRSKIRGAAAKFNPNRIYSGATAYAATRGEREQKQDKQHSKVRRGLANAAFAGGLLVGAGLTFAKFYFMREGADIPTGGHGAGIGGIIGDHIGPNTSKGAPSAPTELATSGSWNFGDGTGGEQLMGAHGIDPTVWYDHEDEFLKTFPDLAYRMNDGHVGLLDQSTSTSASKLPQAAQAWWERRSR